MRSKIVLEDLKYILDENLPWGDFSGKTILIAGANGFIPAYMVETLLYANETILSSKAKIIALVRNIDNAQRKFSDYLEREDFVLIHQNVASPIEIEGDVDYIIHAASNASPAYFMSDPIGTINANVLGTNNLLSLAKEKNVKSFLYFSSGEVNGDAFENIEKVKESDYGIVDPAKVRSCYPESKRMAENMCICWNYQHGIPTKIVRPSHTYGPGFALDDDRAFASFVASVVRSQNILLKSDGSARRSFCYLADAVRAFFMVLLKGKNAEVYNVSQAYEISILELANIMVNLFPEKHLKVEFDENVDRKATPSSKISHGLMAIEKIKELGWQPKYDPEEGFFRTVQSFIEQEQ